MNFFGPYYISSGNLNKFALYARSNFKTISISFMIDSRQYNLSSGNRSSLVTFNAGEFKKQIHVQVKAMGWKGGSWVAKHSAQYILIVSRFNPAETNVGVFKNPTAALTAQGSSHGAAVSVASPHIGVDLVVMKKGTSSTKFFQTTRAALNNGLPIPPLSNTIYWKEASGVIVQLLSCEDSVF